jgi:hypothetical protein
MAKYFYTMPYINKILELVHYLSYAKSEGLNKFNNVSFKLLANDNQSNRAVLCPIKLDAQTNERTNFAYVLCY